MVNRPGQLAGIVTFVGFALYFGWLAVEGVATGAVSYTPRHAGHSVIYHQATEPSGFWNTITFYSVLGGASAIIAVLATLKRVRGQ